MRRHCNVAVILSGAILLAACKGGSGPPPAPQEPASLTASASTVTALAANAVLTVVRITVRDENGTAVPDQTVTFQVVEGGGTLSATSAVSDASGVVTVPTWTFGKSAVPQRLRASLGSLPPVDITGTVQTSYDIVVKFYGPPMSAAQQALFTTAAARLRGIITGNLPPVQMNTTLTGCSEQTINEVVDDVVIYASVQTMDGPGNVLAAAGPCFIRQVGDLTVVGIMLFDSADIAALAADGTLQDVITHEMLHVIGIGSLWDVKELVTGEGTSNPRYTGSRARTECVALGGSSTCASSIPVENLGGPGSADSHWRESVFGSELMTSRSEGGAMPLSLMTIGGLADLGYTVNFAPFDNYTVTLGALQAQMGASSPRTRWELPGPTVIKRVDAKGNVTGVMVRQ